MTQTRIQTTFAPFKKYLPRYVSTAIRSIVTATLGPVWNAYRSGFLISALKMKAVSKDGEPLLWYTYPSIDFLKYRDFKTKFILEFGGGQSTLWWAKRANHVTTIEGDPDWHENIKYNMPANVELHFVPMRGAENTTVDVRKLLALLPRQRYDVIVIDGFYRYEMIDIACDFVAADGIVICDNAEGYGFYDGFRERGMSRVDFYGNAPGVILPHCTSLYFKTTTFVLDPAVPIHVIALE